MGFLEEEILGKDWIFGGGSFGGLFYGGVWRRF